MRLTVVKAVFLLYYVIRITGKEGMDMKQNRVRIVDIADALGLSTATVSNVLHGKTSKISDETVKRVQQELERTGYIPNMASSESNPTLTTIRQDAVLRAKTAIECIEAMRDGRNCEAGIVLPVELIKRESTGELSCQSL